jgi:hypothetical protein
MNKLWIFGDSFSHGHGFNDSDPFYEVTLPDNIDKRYWGEIVADELKLELHNESKVGASNDYILDSILNTASQISKDDYVVIQSAYFSRFDVPHKSSFSFLHTIVRYGDSRHIKVNLIGDDDMTDHKHETLVDFAVYFADLPAYEHRQLNRFEKLIDLLPTKNVAFWCLKKPNSPDIEQINIIKKPYFIMFDDQYVGAESSYLYYKATMTQESNGKVQDGHIGQLGQQIMAMETLKKFNVIYADRRK